MLMCAMRSIREIAHEARIQFKLGEYSKFDPNSTQKGITINEVRDTLDK